MQNVGETSCEEFPLLARACAAFFCVRRGTLAGSYGPPQKWAILPRIIHWTKPLSRQWFACRVSPSFVDLSSSFNFPAWCA
jgi:hypothetical protein